MTQYRILIADDEEEIRYMLELHLKRAGHSVVTVSDGQQALEHLLDAPFDFVLCDLVMPNLDGLEVLEAVTRHGIDVPVVLMSAHATVDVALQAVAKGAFDYVAKPFRADEILFRLKRAVEQRQLSHRVSQLEEVLDERGEFSGMIAQSEPMHAVFKTIRKVANYKTTVLLTGESGTGKELVARALHLTSLRREQPYIAVNCGAIPESLLESELFGHVRGAFTDAVQARKGLFEEADGGTLFLDEIGELSPGLQVKLLRVLQEGEIRKVGASQAQAVDVRVIAATVRNLTEEIQRGHFREDLFYRLNVLPIHLPPLRERRADINLLANHFLRHYVDIFGVAISGFSDEARRLLNSYDWPGNVRELENAVERGVALSEGSTIEVQDLPPKLVESQDRIRESLKSDELSIKKTVRIIEEELIRRALTATNNNRTRAAELLEISHRALLYKIKQYGIDMPPSSSR
ncbi:MAG: sigma-54 dependent transcriptional regulator [Myxococcota bacterium]|nr:sigma-54 dependent transcriptional regulator [Myxococcota bacterium]